MVAASTCLLDKKKITVAGALAKKARATRRGEAVPDFRCSYCDWPVGPWGGKSPHFEHSDRNPLCPLSHRKRGVARKRGRAIYGWSDCYQDLQEVLEWGKTGKYLRLYASSTNEALLYGPDFSQHPLHILAAGGSKVAELVDVLSGAIELQPNKVDPRGFLRYGVRDWQSFHDAVCLLQDFESDTALAPLDRETDGDGVPESRNKVIALKRMVRVAFLTAAASGQETLRVGKTKKVNEFASVDEFLRYVVALVERQGQRCAISGMSLTFDVDAVDKSCLCSLDRINSDGHYEPDNLQVVCRFINRWKGNQPDPEFRALMGRLKYSWSSESV